ncbi:hypothetical protein RBH26_20735 [Natronolimnohabitans sp. A-GB9]|uniref:hypothetical protein n=1 Tax=Natronolimnohabitans sp. A-GB9 TaxID=3069757 RepID=UPI0027B7398B|nr:hypothetical protein [Natronolimnohabitans sp. A-GB9]MDQ2052872.1 hypothetical protein [Natronolimnohabitans sp. A-GB9]
MTSSRITILGVLLVGTLVGTVFSYLTAGSPHEVRTFAALATVQGAFVGIVFSIFVLASQVSATEFSPLTLEQLSKSRTFAGLLLYYTFAILTNVYFIQIDHLDIAVPLIPEDWNLMVGIGTGLATISLLSLLIARQLLVKLTSPEHLLQQTAASVNPSNLTPTSNNDDNLRPQRTPLLTIERILISADRRDDEYTVQQAIYEMHSAIQDIVTEPDVFHSTEINESSTTHTTNFELDIIFERWNTCIEKGKEGPPRRRTLVIQTHQKLLLTLLNQRKEQTVQNNLSGITVVCIAAYNDRQINTSLLEAYDDIFTASLEANADSIPTQIEKELSTICSKILGFSDENNASLEGSYREILSAILAQRIEHIKKVVQSDMDQSKRRRFTETTLNQLNSTLGSCFDQLEDEEYQDANAVKHNLLNDLHLEIIPAVEDCAMADPVITRRMLIAFAELSIELNHDPSLMHERIASETKFNEPYVKEIRQIYIDIVESETPERELTVIDCPQEEIRPFFESAELAPIEVNCGR